MASKELSYCSNLGQSSSVSPIRRKMAKNCSVENLIQESFFLSVSLSVLCHRPNGARCCSSLSGFASTGISIQITAPSRRQSPTVEAETCSSTNWLRTLAQWLTVRPPGPSWWWWPLGEVGQPCNSFIRVGIPLFQAGGNDGSGRFKKYLAQI